MRSIRFVIIAGDAMTTRFMRDADMFESFKAFATPTRLEMTVEDWADQAKCLNAVREAYEKGGKRVVAVFVPNDPVGAWRDETVKSVSDGQRWCMLDDMLKHYFYKAAEPATA